MLIENNKVTNKFYYFDKDEYIVKHSKNIIDLIEVGDYVNGQEVLCFRNDNCDYDLGTEYNDDYGYYFGIGKQDIKSIVTSEQFKSVEYKVERE